LKQGGSRRLKENSTRRRCRKSRNKGRHPSSNSRPLSRTTCRPRDERRADVVAPGVGEETRYKTAHVGDGEADAVQIARRRHAGDGPRIWRRIEDSVAIPVGVARAVLFRSYTNHRGQSPWQLARGADHYSAGCENTLESLAMCRIRCA